MAELPPPSKPSGLKPPSKIGRPCTSSLPKPAVPPQTPKMNGASGSIRKLSDDLIKTRINEEAEESDDFTSDFFARRYSSDRKSSIGGLSSNDSLWGDISLARRLSEAGIRRTSDNSVILTEDTDSFIVGDRVWVGGTKPGRIAYIGETKFAPGDWAGIVLDEPIGKNDGAVGNTRYFQCEPKKGIFSKLTRLTRSPLALPEPSSPLTQTPIPSTPLASPPSSVKGSTASRSPPSSVLSTPAPAPTGELKIGERVIVMSQQGSKAGILRFKGTTSFAAGEWCGVELDDPLGKNDGTVDGVRYFTCEPKFGLFAPAHKVSRSPARNRRPSCQVHHNATSLRRASSKESLTSSIASSVRTTASTARKTLIRPLTSPTSSTPKPSAQDLVKCKQDQINQLLKEKQMDRTALTNAAQQADELERKLGVLQIDYDKVCSVMTELKVRNDVAAMESTELKMQNDRLKAKVDELQAQLEDVQFRAEEETCIKSDIQLANEQNEEKIRELEQLLLIEQTKNESLLEDASQIQEVMNKFIALQTELETAVTSREEMEKTLKQELIDTIDRANRMEQSYNEAQDKLDKIMSELETDKAKLLESVSDESTKLRKDLEEMTNQNKEIQGHVIKLENNRSELIKTIETRNEEISRLIQEVNTHKSNFEVQENEKQSSLAKLDNQIKETANLKTEYDNKCKECSEAVSRLEDLAKKLQDSERLSANQLDVIDNLKKEIENNKSSSTSQMEEMSRTLEIEMSKMKIELEQSLENLKDRDAEIEKIRSVGGKLNEVLKENSVKIAELEAALIEKEKTANDLRESLSSTEDNSKKVIEDLNVKVNNLMETLGNERAALTASVNDREILEKDRDKAIDDLGSKTKLFEAEIASIKNEKGVIESELHQIRKSLLKETDTVEQLQAELKTKDGEISSKSEEISELKKSTEELQEVKSSLEDSVNAVRVQVQKLELELGDSQRRLADATDRCEQLSNQKAKLENDMTEMISTSSDSSTQLTRINTELNEKLKELDDLKLSTSEAAREHKNREQELSQQLESAKTSRDELVKELDSFKELNETQTNQLQNNFKAKISELESLLEESTKTQVTTKKQKDELNEKVLKLEQSLKEMGNQFEESVKSREELMKNFEATKKQAEENEKEKSDKSKEIDSLVSKIASLENDVKSLSEDKLRISRQLKELEVAGIKSSEDAEIMREENTSLKEKIDSLVNATGSEMSVMKNLMDEKDSLLKAHIGNIERLKTMLSESEEKVKLFIKEAEGSKGELEEIKVSLRDAEEGRQNAIKDKEALTAENEKLKTHSSELENHIRSSGVKESQLKEEIGVLEQRLATLGFSLEASSKTIEALKASQRESETQLEDARRETSTKESELNQRIEAMNKQLSELNIVLEMSQEEHDLELDKLKHQVDTLAADLKRKQEELVQSCEKIGKYENELKMVSANSSDANKSLTEEIERLKKKDVESEKTIGSLNDHLKSSNGEIQDKSQIVNKLEAHVASLEKEIQKLSKQGDDLANAKLNYESEISELTNERRKGAEERSKLAKELEESQAQALRFKQQLETEVSNRAASTTDLAKLESQLNMARQEKINVDERLRAAQEEIARLKFRPDTPQKPVQAENGGVRKSEDEELNNWLEEKELVESQINFLNAIIVDMKKKNEDLQAKLDAYEGNGIQLSPTKVAKEVAPRLFCDICDMFDLHDTEDCPQQASSDSPPPTHHVPAGTRKMEERPYCDICEMFGHDSAECDDAETF